MIWSTFNFCSQRSNLIVVSIEQIKSKLIFFCRLKAKKLVGFALKLCPFYIKRFFSEKMNWCELIIITVMIGRQRGELH